ncbi:MAG: hypothetical protein ACLUE8_11455 [Lachnospiraceae bacterium]
MSSHTGKLKKPVIFGVVSDLHDEPYDDLWPLLAGCDALLVPGDVVNRYTQTSARESLFCGKRPGGCPPFSHWAIMKRKPGSFRP